MAELTEIVSHKVMLRHMADTWDRIAADIQWLGNVAVSQSAKIGNGQARPKNKSDPR